MKQIIAMHGWNGDSNIWHHWKNTFQHKGWRWQSAERGYGELLPKHPNWYLEEEANSNECRALIAHSLGPHLIDHKVLAKATDVVLLCSFGRFITNGRDSRNLKTALHGMKSRLGTPQQQAMLDTFITKAHFPSTPDPSIERTRPNGVHLNGRRRLKHDLDLLIQTQGIPNGIAKNARVLVIQGEKDAIISSSTRECLLKDLQKHLRRPLSHWLIPNAGHWLVIPELINDVHIWLDNTP